MYMSKESIIINTELEYVTVFPRDLETLIQKLFRAKGIKVNKFILIGTKSRDAMQGLYIPKGEKD